MPLTDLCAVVVTYHPDDSVLENLAALAPQVARLVVVDNGSSADELLPLRSAASTLRFELIENGVNLGIATALNIGVRRALAIDSTDTAWIALFDQDSRVTPGFIETMVAAFAGSPYGARLGILVPRYTDLRSGTSLPVLPLRSGGLQEAITSGSLMRTGLFHRLGFFVDELFIDGVDHEWSLRVRKAGLVIDQCCAAELLHSPGTPATVSVGGRALFLSTNYSPVRRYYQERNKVWIVRRYGIAFPGFCLRLAVSSFKELLKILLVESSDKSNKGKNGESSKREKLRYFLRGLFDGLRNRMGPMSVIPRLDRFVLFFSCVEENRTQGTADR